MTIQDAGTVVPPPKYTFQVTDDIVFSDELTKRFASARRALFTRAWEEVDKRVKQIQSWRGFRMVVVDDVVYAALHCAEYRTIAGERVIPVKFVPAMVQLQATSNEDGLYTLCADISRCIVDGVLVCRRADAVIQHDDAEEVPYTGT